MFVAELCGKKLVLVAVHAGIYVTVFTIPDCRLYYTKYIFFMRDGFAHFTHSSGITHIIFTALQICYTAAGFIMLFLSLYREKMPTARKRLRMVIYAITAMTVFYAVQISGVFSELTQVFDVTMIGYTFCTTFMYIAILRCDLPGAGELAREYMTDRLSEGIIAVSNNTAVHTGGTAVCFFPRNTAFPAKNFRELRSVRLIYRGEYNIKNRQGVITRRRSRKTKNYNLSCPR